MKRLITIVTVSMLLVVGMLVPTQRSSALTLPKNLGDIVRIVPAEKRKCPINVTDSSAMLPFWCGCRWFTAQNGTQPQTQRQIVWPCRCPQTLQSTSNWYCGCKKYVAAEDQQTNRLCPLIKPQPLTPNIEDSTSDSTVQKPTMLDKKSSDVVPPTTTPSTQPKIYPGGDLPTTTTPTKPYPIKMTPGIVPPTFDRSNL